MSTKGSKIISMLILSIGLSVVGASAQDSGVPVSVTLQGGPAETATAASTATAETTETPIAVSTNAVGGFNSTVPVVAQLPETGVLARGAETSLVFVTLLTAGGLLMIGGILSSRYSNYRRAE